MKFYAVVALLLLVAMHNASADWKNDVKHTHWKSGSNLITTVIKSNLSKSMMNPGLASCVNSSNSQLTNLLRTFNQELDQAIASAANERDANQRCEIVSRQLSANVMRLSC
ncbi:uncharacterized protein LOC116418379 [Nasonia vitripennis]|uniref:Uncharacterized protein n=1 Tax=Nasonia vitripennis TaxID=7425 RepID=A0A7M7QL85_NASVI|nr:uncharacterized protein LOC116418379 [Nasonia vitripennis]